VKWRNHTKEEEEEEGEQLLPVLLVTLRRMALTNHAKIAVGNLWTIVPNFVITVELIASESNILTLIFSVNHW